MQKKIFILVAVFSALIVDAQILKVDSIERVTIPESEMTEQVVGISPKGDFLLLSSQSQEGLVRFDLSKKAITTAIRKSKRCGHSKNEVISDLRIHSLKFKNYTRTLK